MTNYYNKNNWQKQEKQKVHPEIEKKKDDYFCTKGEVMGVMEGSVGSVYLKIALETGVRVYD